MFNPTSDQMVDFVLKNGYELFTESDREQMKKYLEIHKNFGTLFIVTNENSIVALCRWNWVSEDTVLILDLLINPDYRNKRLLKEMLIRAKLQYPQLEFLKFHRKKHNNRISAYMIDQFLKTKGEARVLEPKTDNN